jgi:hypothetical protein
MMYYDRYNSCTDLSPGTYTARVEASHVVYSHTTKNVGVTIRWQLVERFEGRRAWRTLWLSPAAISRSKRELTRLGVHKVASLDNDPPVPPGALCRLVIAEQLARDGCREIRIVRWDVLSCADTGEGVEKP